MQDRGFRRFPLGYLQNIRSRTLSKVLSRAYDRIDVSGRLSDIFADPQKLYEWWWPYKAIRRRVFRQLNPSVSVVIATKNNEATIEGALRSLMAQTIRNIEIIVVNDASSDQTGEIAERLAEQDNRIQVLHNEVSEGTGASRNRGMNAAKGKYITFQDGDDYSLPTRLEMQVDAFKESDGIKIVLCNYVRITSDGTTLQINKNRVMKCIISMMFLRDEVLARVGGFLSESISEDSDFYERIKITYGSDCERIVFRTLYHALFRPESSFFSQTTIQYFDGKKVKYKKQPAAIEHWENIRSSHGKMRDIMGSNEEPNVAGQ